jgi:16S rRNA (adenine1518-N6/adenine1519-N6)-dimethyltransferase
LVRLGQNFLADPNLLDAIVRDAGLVADDVVLEVGAGEGVLAERLAPLAAHVHTVEIDRRLAPALAPLAALANVSLHWGDAMKVDLAGFEPAPMAMVANLPYSVATPLILRTIELLPSLASWTVMVQREIADRLRAAPGSRTYGSPSVVAQLACEVELVRKVDPAVFRPRPRVDSAILRLRRRGPAADAATQALIRAAFAHRRKSLARSLEHGRAGSLAPARQALAELGLAEDARAEALSPEEFAALSAKLQANA